MAAKSDGKFQEWLEEVMQNYKNLTDAERNKTIDSIIACSNSSQLSYLYTQTFIFLYRDFIKLLPIELKEYILFFLDGKSLLLCCNVSKAWNSIISSSCKVWQVACLRAGLIVNKNIDNGDARYWKSFFITMSRRLDQMKNYKCFLSTTYERNLRRVTAVFYYKGKVATASDSKIIQIWDCTRDVCLASIRTDSSVAQLKFDDNILVASSYLGHMVSWNIVTGQRLTEYMCHSGAVFTFDYSRDLNMIISGSADCNIKIWALSNGYLFKTLHEHTRWVLKVLLCPYPTERDSKEKRHLLISMDKTDIKVRLMNFVSSESSVDGLYITTLYSIKHGHPTDNCLFTTGLHFDGEYLYFLNHLSTNEHNRTDTFCTWNVKEKCLVSEIDLGIKVKTLLGVGKKYFVVLAPWQGKTMPNLIVMDKESLERIAVWQLPSSRLNKSPDGSQFCLGEKDWLNGLNGKNDQGVVLTAAIDENCVYILKWIPRSDEEVT